MTTRYTSLETDLVLMTKMTLERKQTCVAFLIEGFFTGVFLFILRQDLLVLQLPVIIAFIILYPQPSFAKQLLIQQRLGMVMIGICMIKSLFLIVNMIIYLINFFNTNEYRAPSHPTVQNQVFQAFQKDEYLFPPLVPNSVPGLSAFLGAVLAILFGLMTVFEILAIYSGSFLLKKTKKMIEKIASMRIMSLQPPQQATENSNNPLQADSNDIVTNNQQVEQNPPNSAIVV